MCECSVLVNALYQFLLFCVLFLTNNYTVDLLFSYSFNFNTNPTVIFPSILDMLLKIALCSSLFAASPASSVPDAVKCTRGMTTLETVQIRFFAHSPEKQCSCVTISLEKTTGVNFLPVDAAELLSERSFIYSLKLLTVFMMQLQQ